jgi:hypothetical protein
MKTTHIWAVTREPFPKGLKMSITQFLDKLQEKSLWSYGWHIEDQTETIYDQVIEPGEYIYFYDDDSDTWGHGVYMGLYEDLNKSHETSPYFNEAYNGIERIVVQDAVINEDSSLTVRTNYILPENAFGGYESNNKTFNFLAVA